MISVVVPTVGRPSLETLLRALASSGEPRGAASGGPHAAPPDELIIVHDRAGGVVLPEPLRAVARVIAGPGRGPAAARNVGWRAATGEWVAFLDDDVVPSPTWLHDLRVDLAGTSAVAVQGLVEVPLPADRRPTDWERSTAGLATAKWITADLAVRRAALEAVGGFDERFPRAYREDADLAARLRSAGGALRVGTRRISHPVRPESPLVSIGTQRGNADDALLRRLYGPAWRERLEIPPGRRRRHAFVTAAGALALAGLLTGHRRVAASAGLGWLLGTAEFAWRRISPGPRTPAEVSAMLVTSAAIPPLAVAHWLRGWWKWRNLSTTGYGSTSKGAGEVHT
ncbi:transferase [Virgisporangium aliadipatigenens]|uniref:Transferase n=1 Tax=Virgisporangium aliadipatigenens TaxID=741659 RepID=A0A8J3YNH2_9ACTN|nr:glycosyltransferase [Virgisporangium aliadipatigenens]GIJ47046.1 transferase [Virgisporangium aliadipatigenens]